MSMCQSIEPWLNRNSRIGALAGCTLADTGQLMNDLCSLVFPLEAEWIDNTEHDPKHRIHTTLTGPNGGRHRQVCYSVPGQVMKYDPTPA